jgi:hypothetical protein
MGTTAHSCQPGHKFQTTSRDGSGSKNDLLAHEAVSAVAT